MASKRLLASIANNVRRQRALHGWTQAELATRAGMAQSRISDLERGIGDPSVGTVEKIAHALGLSYIALVADTEVAAVV